MSQSSLPSKTPPKTLAETNHDQLPELLRVAQGACDGAKSILDKYFGNLKSIDEKFQAGLVSEADKESEKYIVDYIRRYYPAHAILGEEGGLTGAADVSQSGGALWIIDPLDGTTNYIHQFPFFCISIGLELHSELVLGVVDAPKLGHRYHATKGGGAFLNGQPIHVSKRTEFRDGLFSTGFCSYDNELEQHLRLVTDTIRDSRGIRRAGAAALDLCFVAQGVFDTFWEKNLAAWDMAAGVVIAREAGGVATDFSGKDFSTHDNSIICGSPALQPEILRRHLDYRKK